MASESRRSYVSDYDERSGQEDSSEGKNSLLPGSAYPPPSRDYVPSPRAGRSRASSSAPPPTFGQQSQPLRPVKEAVVDNVFHQTETTNQVTPDLVAQITEQVIQSLKLNGMVGQGQAQTDHDAPPLSFKSTSGILPPHVVTPPRSERHEGSNVGSFSRPTFQDDWEGDDLREYKSFSSYDEEIESPKHTSTKLPEPPRSKPLQQELEDDTTTLEKVWQPLFDANGRGTPRLGQFLRGLALHIIADFEPQHSIVVTPQKMLKFYNDVKVANELYPWQKIFDGTMSHSNLSYLYRDLQCEHFFVQEKTHGRPTIPALTPSGFEAWMTHNIRAHPDIEYKRFADAVLNMPISNADDPKERFPKELSRRLFPLQANVPMQVELEESILEEKKIKLPRRAANANAAAQPSSSFSSQAPQAESSRHHPSFSNSTSSPTPFFPPPQSQSQSRTLRHTSPVRTTSPIRHSQKAPPSQSQSQSQAHPQQPIHMYDSGNESSSNSQSSHSPPAISLERERKPYIAQPGGGKVHDNASSSNPNSAPPTPRSATGAGLRPEMPRQMSDVPEESPGGSRPGTSGRDKSRRDVNVNNSSSRDVNTTSSNNNNNNNSPNPTTTRSNSTTREREASSRPPTRTSSVARHSTGPPRKRRSSSLAAAAANVKPGFAYSRSDEFPPSSYSHSRDGSVGLNSSSGGAGAGAGHDAYDREPRSARGDGRERERDSEEERGSAASRRYSRSSEEGQGSGPRVRRYVVPDGAGGGGSGGGSGGGAGGGGAARYKMPMRQGSLHEDDYYRGRNPMV